MSSATYLTNGIVLRRRDYREFDRIITVFTEEYGKIDAVARGVRKIVSKLAGHLEPLSYASFMLARGRVFDVLATSVRLSSFRIPQTDLLAFALASYFFEAVDRMTRPNQQDKALFHLLVDYLATFEHTADDSHRGTAFQRVLTTEYSLFQLLRALGFAPSLERCISGQEHLASAEVAGITLAGGGVVCAAHRKAGDELLQPSQQAVEALRLMADGELAALRLIEQNAGTLREIAQLENGMIVYHIGEPLASEPFLRSLLQ